MTINDTVKYYDAIPDIIENYNKTVHSATKKTPPMIKGIFGILLILSDIFGLSFIHQTPLCR